MFLVDPDETSLYRKFASRLASSLLWTRYVDDMFQFLVDPDETSLYGNFAEQTRK